MSSASNGPQTTLNPYLELPHLLSLTWLAYPVLSLGFILFRLIQSEISSQDALASAKENLLASCRAAEHASSGAASMPRYMAAATNRQIQDAVNSTMNGARATILVSLTILEVIINFVIDIYRGTLLCFLEFAVRTLISSLISVTGEYNKFVQDIAAPLATKLSNGITSFNSAVQSALATVPSFARPNLPQFDAPDLGPLVHANLHSGVQDSLVQLNASLPTVAELKKAIEGLVDTPFELLKQEINKTFDGLSFNVNAIPLPNQNFVTFCNNVDTGVVDDLSRDLRRATIIGICAILACAVLLILGNCVVQWWRWRGIRRQLDRVRMIWVSDPDPSDRNLMRIRANFAHPLLMRFADWLVGVFRLSPRAQIHLYWFFAYIFHGPALACFLIGFFGIISVQIQLFLIGPLAAQYRQRTAGAVKNFATTIATAINDSMYNQSATYANDVNSRINAVQKTVNDGLFSWVNGTTNVINATVSTFYADLQQSVQKAFGNSFLETPAQTLVRCIIGSKVIAIQDATEFLQTHLRLDMPRVHDTVLLMSNSSVDEVSNAVATAASGGGTEGGKEPLIQRIIGKYVKALEKERLFFAVFLGLWFVVVLMGLFVLAKHSCCGRRYKGEKPPPIPIAEKERPPSLPRTPRDPYFAGFSVDNPFKRMKMPKWQMPQRRERPPSPPPPPKTEREASPGWMSRMKAPSIKVPKPTPVTIPFHLRMPAMPAMPAAPSMPSMPGAPSFNVQMPSMPSMPSLPTPPRRQRKERPESMMPLLEETREADRHNKHLPAVPKEPRRLTPETVGGGSVDPNPFFTPFDDEHGVAPGRHAQHQGPIAF